MKELLRCLLGIIIRQSLHEATQTLRSQMKLARVITAAQKLQIYLVLLSSNSSHRCIHMLRSNPRHYLRNYREIVYV